MKKKIFKLQILVIIIAMLTISPAGSKIIHKNIDLDDPPYFEITNLTVEYGKITATVHAYRGVRTVFLDFLIGRYIGNELIGPFPFYEEVFGISAGETLNWSVAWHDIGHFKICAELFNNEETRVCKEVWIPKCKIVSFNIINFFNKLSSFKQEFLYNFK